MRKIRYAVIGTKGIGVLHSYLAKKHENVELVALVDIDETAVKEQANKHRVRWFTDYRDLLDAGIVDAVSIATPHHLHSEIGLACLKAGVHIFMEKPFANRVSEADAMIAAAKVNNLKIGVAHQYRTYRSPQKIKHLIEEGAIGKISRILWSWVEFRPESYYRDRWHSTWQHSGGGVLMNQASHDLDLICWLIGKPKQVSALIGNQLHKAEIEDIVCANVLFENGAFGSLQLTINQPRGYSIRQIAGDKGIVVVQDVQSLTSDRYDRILLGTYEDRLSKMAIDLGGNHDQPKTKWQTLDIKKDPNLENLIRQWDRQASQKLKEIKLLKYPSLLQRLGLLKKEDPPHHLILMDSFIDAILNGGEPIVNGENTLPTIELINAIILSALRNKTVDFPIDREEYDSLFEELSSRAIEVPIFR
ncbi:MAG TPA: Gfo/Idh/MocA family oxidoreductase [Leptolyngbyaceae cyanobacterium]